MPDLPSRTWIRGLLAGAAGGIAWFAGIMVVFGIVQGILTDPTLQSAKFIAAFAEPPLPRQAEWPGLLPIGLLVIGALVGLAYHLLAAGGAGSRWRRGSRFGFAAWLIAMPWFEFYLPFNVMREPPALVALELVCWFVVFQAVGVTIALVYHGRSR